MLLAVIRFSEFNGQTENKAGTVSNKLYLIYKRIFGSVVERPFILEIISWWKNFKGKKNYLSKRLLWEIVERSWPIIQVQIYPEKWNLMAKILKIAAYNFQRNCLNEFHNTTTYIQFMLLKIFRKKLRLK